MNLGENIYHYRTQKNMSQGDLADALEVSRQSVSKWENNAATPELEKLMKMAQIFDITIDELVTGEQREAPAPTPSPALESAPQPAPAPATPEPFLARKIVGIILLACGLLAAIILFAVGFFTGAYIWSLIIGLPLVLIGLCCLLVKKHALLVCGWVLYILIFFLLTLMACSGDMLVTYLMLALCIALSIGSLVVLWSRKNQASLVAKILLTLLILGALWPSLVSSLAVSSFYSYSSEETHTVPAPAVPD